MAVRKILTSIVLAGALALGGAGCLKNNPGLHFYGSFIGKIGEEQVKFNAERSAMGGVQVLAVTKTDGSKIVYTDSNGDSKIDYVQITIGKDIAMYEASSKNPVTTEVIERAQENFDAYLTNIIEINTASLNRE